MDHAPARSIAPTETSPTPNLSAPVRGRDKRRELVWDVPPFNQRLYNPSPDSPLPLFELTAMRSCLVVTVCILNFATRGFGQSTSNVDWPRVGNDPGCMRYSQLEQVNRGNVAQLKPVWTYHKGEL